MQKKTKNTLQRNAWIKRANKRFHVSRWGCIAGLPKQWKGGRVGVAISYVASVPAFVCCEFEREQKKWVEGGERGQERNKISSLSRFPHFFALPSTFINSSIGNAWKAVYRQSGCEQHFFSLYWPSCWLPKWKSYKGSRATTYRMKLGQGKNHYR